MPAGLLGCALFYRSPNVNPRGRTQRGSVPVEPHHSAPALIPTLGPSSITQPRSKRPPSFGTTASVPAGRLTSQTAPGVKVKAALRAPAIVYHWMPGATLIPVSTPREEGPLHPGKAQGGELDRCMTVVT